MKINKVAVIGAGTMGSGIAGQIANANSITGLVESLVGVVPAGGDSPIRN